MDTELVSLASVSAILDLTGITAVRVSNFHPHHVHRLRSHHHLFGVVSDVTSLPFCQDSWEQVFSISHYAFYQMWHLSFDGTIQPKGPLNPSRLKFHPSYADKDSGKELIYSILSDLFIEFFLPLPHLKTCAHLIFTEG